MENKLNLDPKKKLKIVETTRSSVQNLCRK